MSIYTVRVDKNIVSNIDKLFKHDILSEDEGLIKSLLYYFAKSYEKNYFTFGLLDPEDFAKEMGYSLSYLRKRHANPHQLKGLSSELIDSLYSKEHQDPNLKIWDTTLENALYLLCEVPLNLDRTGKYYSVNNYIRTEKIVSKIQILTDIRCEHVLRGDGRMERVQYKYIINSQFIYNTTCYFVTGLQNTLIKLRKTKDDKAYLYFKNLQGSLFSVGSEDLHRDCNLSFSLLLDLFDINTKTKDGRMISDLRLADKIKAKLEELRTATEVNFQYSMKREKTDLYNPYKVVITFPNTTDKHYNRKFEQRANIFFLHLMHSLIEMYKTKLGVEYPDEREFYSWLTDSVDSQLKELAFKNAQFFTFNKLTTKTDQLAKRWIYLLTNRSINNSEELRHLINNQLY